MKAMKDMTEPELRDLMNAVARAVNRELPAPWAGHRSQFVVLVFDDPAVAQYISSCDRSTMVEALRECADRLESREDIPR